MQVCRKKVQEKQSLKRDGLGSGVYWHGRMQENVLETRSKNRDDLSPVSGVPLYMTCSFMSYRQVVHAAPIIL